MTPLYSIKGWENLPTEVDSVDLDSIYQNGKIDGHNQAIAEIEKCGIVVDEDKLIKALRDMLDESRKGVPGFTYTEKVFTPKEIAKSISATLPNWIEIRRVE